MCDDCRDGADGCEPLRLSDLFLHRGKLLLHVRKFIGNGVAEVGGGRLGRWLQGWIIYQSTADIGRVGAAASSGSGTYAAADLSDVKSAAVLTRLRPRALDL